MNNSQSQKLFYRFRVFADGQQPQQTDPLGFNNEDEVWEEAAMSSCDLIRSMRGGGVKPGLDWRLEVSDDTAKVIYRFSYKAEKI